VEPAIHKGRLGVCEGELQPSAAKRTKIIARIIPATPLWRRPVKRFGYLKTLRQGGDAIVTGKLPGFRGWTGLKPLAFKVLLKGSDIALKGGANF
jgi:hypothetical protein